MTIIGNYPTFIIKNDRNRDFFILIGKIVEESLKDISDTIPHIICDMSQISNS